MQSPEVNPEQWVVEHSDALFAFAISRVGDKEVAEDIVQETFLAAIRASDQFRGRAKVRTWLISILKNKIVDHFRRQSRSKIVDDESVPELADGDFNAREVWASELLKWPTDPSRTLVETEFWGVFAACREKLPDRLLAAFTMREIEQRDVDDICRLLDVTRANLAVRIYRARMMLRNCLEKNWFQKEK
ncbi:MAG: sigma-70 family RNA polymerase sigma factor [Planctomycetota bacterium]